MKQMNCKVCNKEMTVEDDAEVTAHLDCLFRDWDGEENTIKYIREKL